MRETPQDASAAGGWTYRVIAKHTLLVEQDSIANIREAMACRSADAAQTTTRA